jgi:hypothetical protein
MDEPITVAALSDDLFDARFLAKGIFAVDEPIANSPSSVAKRYPQTIAILRYY